MEYFDFTDKKILRSAAEEQVKKTNGTKSDALTHELEVHQIELEMQNDELKLAYEISENASKKYTLLFDFAPIGYFILKLDGHILDLNFSGAEMLREKRCSLINKNFKLFVQSKLSFSNFLEKLQTSTKESCEVTLEYDNNILCKIYIEGIFIDDKYMLYAFKYKQNYG